MNDWTQFLFYPIWHKIVYYFKSLNSILRVHESKTTHSYCLHFDVNYCMITFSDNFVLLIFDTFHCIFVWCNTRSILPNLLYILLVYTNVLFIVTAGTSYDVMIPWTYISSLKTILNNKRYLWDSVLHAVINVSIIIIMKRYSIIRLYCILNTVTNGYGLFRLLYHGIDSHPLNHNTA